MKQLIKNFKKYRFLLSELVIKDIKLKYRRSYLGILWTLIEPLLTMIVLSVVFSSFYGRNDRTFPIYVLSGRLLYSFFSNATKSAMRSIRTNGQMMKKVYVPKYIYPLSSILSQYVIFLISLIVLVCVAAYLRVKPTIHLLEAIVPLIILFVMVLGVGLILATLAVFFRDMEYLWGVILMMIMYCSAIFYDPERVVKTGNGWILQINPLYSVILNFRNTVIYGQGLDLNALLYSAGFSIAALVIGLFMFYKKQDQFIMNL
ncbi:MAG TPA: ABC transporter permease [Clostridiales bacterium]|nr:ABC transporter permease [Clostridiales bacterium]